MKKKALVLLLVLALFSPLNHVNANNIEVETRERIINYGEVKNCQNENYDTLSNVSIGYGSGVQLGSDNRPFCATDFNAQFSQYDAYAITNNENEIYLTFDQGYENGYTHTILDVLKEKNVTAIFFILEDYARRSPELVERMIVDGHIVGNHSFHHYSMPTLDTNTCRKEITSLHDYVKEKFDYDMWLFRPPKGEFSEKTLAITQDTGYTTMMWSFAYADWNENQQPDPEKSLEKMTNSLHDGAIYMLHSVSATNAEIIDEFIDNARNAGYEFTVPKAT